MQKLLIKAIHYEWTHLNVEKICLLDNADIIIANPINYVISACRIEKPLLITKWVTPLTSPNILNSNTHPPIFLGNFKSKHTESCYKKTDFCLTKMSTFIPKAINFKKILHIYYFFSPNVMFIKTSSLVEYCGSTRVTRVYDNGSLD